MTRVSSWLHHSSFRLAVSAATLLPTPLWASRELKTLAPAAQAKEPTRTGHFFNAALMPEGSYQIDASSHFRAGLTPNLEVSVIGLGLIFRPTFWNIGIKHRMFETGGTRTSFNSHSLAFKNKSELWVASLHGVVTGFSINAHHEFSLGLMDGLIMTFAPDVQSSLHLITPVLAWDGTLNRRWAVSLIFARPVYAVGQLESEATGEGNLEIDFTQKNYNPGLGFLTVKYSWSRASLEGGFVYLSAAFAAYTPYINFAWRFGGYAS